LVIEESFKEMRLIRINKLFLKMRGGSIMEREVYIHEILDFLEDNEIDFNFVGKKDEKIEGFSTLFNYKKSKMTFISMLYKFKDYSKEFNEKTIKLILTDPSEEIYSCFENTIQIKKPTNAFFSIIEHF